MQATQCICNNRLRVSPPLSTPVIPAERAGLRPASESRNPVTKAVCAFTPAVDYWVPARASPVEPGSLGRDDSHIPSAPPGASRVRPSRHTAIAPPRCYLAVAEIALDRVEAALARIPV